eukprot:7764637-Heterocapsa_arctica.AAC.1
MDRESYPEGMMAWKEYRLQLLPDTPRYMSHKILPSLWDMCDMPHLAFVLKDWDSYPNPVGIRGLVKLPMLNSLNNEYSPMNGHRRLFCPYTRIPETCRALTP